MYFFYVTLKFIFAKKPLYFNSFVKSNILFIKDIWDFANNNFISIDTLLRKLKCTRNWIAEWHILKSSIPKMYITALKDHHYETVSNYTHLDEHDANKTFA
jgi:hypothetical protein